MGITFRPAKTREEVNECLTAAERMVSSFVRRQEYEGLRIQEMANDGEKLRLSLTDDQYTHILTIETYFSE